MRGFGSLLQRPDAGACRASIGTFPAVAKGLARLGVDDATIAALTAHDVGEHIVHPLVQPSDAPPATPADAGPAKTGAVYVSPSRWLNWQQPSQDLAWHLQVPKAAPFGCCINSVSYAGLRCHRLRASR